MSDHTKIVEEINKLLGFALNFAENKDEEEAFKVVEEIKAIAMKEYPGKYIEFLRDVVDKKMTHEELLAIFGEIGTSPKQRKNLAKNLNAVLANNLDLNIVSDNNPDLKTHLKVIKHPLFHCIGDNRRPPKFIQEAQFGEYKVLAEAMLKYNQNKSCERYTRSVFYLISLDLQYGFDKISSDTNPIAKKLLNMVRNGEELSQEIIDDLASEALNKSLNFSKKDNKLVKLNNTTNTTQAAGTSDASFFCDETALLIHEAGTEGKQQHKQLIRARTQILNAITKDTLSPNLEVFRDKNIFSFSISTKHPISQDHFEKREKLSNTDKILLSNLSYFCDFMNSKFAFHGNHFEKFCNIITDDLEHCAEFATLMSNEPNANILYMHSVLAVIERLGPLELQADDANHSENKVTEFLSDPLFLLMKTCANAVSKSITTDPLLLQQYKNLSQRACKILKNTHDTNECFSDKQDVLNDIEDIYDPSYSDNSIELFPKQITLSDPKPSSSDISTLSKPEIFKLLEKQNITFSDLKDKEIEHFKNIYQDLSEDEQQKWHALIMDCMENETMAQRVGKKGPKPHLRVSEVRYQLRYGAAETSIPRGPYCSEKLDDYNRFADKDMKRDDFFISPMYALVNRLHEKCIDRNIKNMHDHCDDFEALATIYNVAACLDKKITFHAKNKIDKKYHSETKIEEIISKRFGMNK